jgi:signal peptidase I
MTLRRILTFTAVAALVALAGAFAYAWSNGMRFYAVESGSMSPAMHQGDLVVDAPTTATATYWVGEIITFHPTPGYITTHRIVAIDAAGISTKGDANSTADLGKIPPKNVVGRVIAVVPYGGYVATFFRQPAGIFALVLVIVALYIGWELVRVRKPDAPSGPDTDADTESDAPDATEGDPG